MANDNHRDVFVVGKKQNNLYSMKSKGHLNLLPSIPKFFYFLLISRAS